MALDNWDLVLLALVVSYCVYSTRTYANRFSIGDLVCRYLNNISNHTLCLPQKETNKLSPSHGASHVENFCFPRQPHKNFVSTRFTFEISFLFYNN